MCTLTVENSTFVENRAALGGGIANEGTLTVTNSTFTANVADAGDDIFNEGTVTLTRVTLNECVDSGAGTGCP